MLSLVIPVYRNEENLDSLLRALSGLHEQVGEPMEVVFVVDGSPDRCHEILRERLPSAPFPSRLILLSRNFGAFCAVAAGLAAGTGERFAVLAADLQEPPELVVQFSEALRSGRADVVFGCRASRSDPWLSELLSNTFWAIYRRFVVKDMPKGGVDVFACTREVRDRVLELKEVNTNLIALFFWVGFRREFVSYRRLPRKEGKSAWTVAKKLRYCFDSLFNFTDLPIKFLIYLGLGGMTFAALCSAIVITAKIQKHIPVPGYTPIVLAIMFFGGLTSLALGIIGQYLWLALQNTRNRPVFIVAESREYNPAASGSLRQELRSKAATGGARG
jgi:glycosyltransferase involved in cell wall biosynthesis